MTPTRSPRHLFGACAVLFVAISLSGCGQDDPETESADTESATEQASADEITITDAQARNVTLAAEPEVVVVTDWSAIRTLSDLDIDVDAVPQAVGELPTDLASHVEGVPEIGTVFEPDYEAIQALEPDLVIVGSRSGTPEVVAELEKISPAVLDLSVRAEQPSDTWRATEERVVQLGTIFGRQDEAQGVMDDLASQIDEVSSEASASGASAMFVQVSDGTIGAYGPGSRFGSIYEDFGYASTNAPLDEEGSHGEEISQEFFVQYNPGVLFVLDRAKAIGDDQTPALQVLDNALANSTDAAQNDKIIEVDGFSWYLAASAPSSWQQMIDDVKASL
ncbi:MAG: ABC transporter substrate-binding protein [Ornithinimicrobium sp.]